MADLPALPARPASGHKGTFGTVGVLGGQAAGRMMVGGPALSALAALRSGAGLAVLLVPEPIAAATLTVAPSATAVPLPVDESGRLAPSAAAEAIDAFLPSCNCLAIGPGFGAAMAQRQIVMRLIASDDVPPLVLDADALNALAATPEFHADVRAASIVTPHPGEYRRLAERLSIDADPTDEATRPAAAEQLAQRLGCIVVLKGKGTVVTDGQRTHVNQTGGAVLATAGTGDVLTGLIAGLVAQFHRPAPYPVTAAADDVGLSLFECARIAVSAHGRAADSWSAVHGAAGMLATDLVEAIPAAIHAMRA